MQFRGNQASLIFKKHLSPQQLLFHLLHSFVMVSFAGILDRRARPSEGYGRLGGDVYLQPTPTLPR